MFVINRINITIFLNNKINLTHSKTMLPFFHTKHTLTYVAEYCIALNTVVNIKSMAIARLWHDENEASIEQSPKKYFPAPAN